jgi:hypothetical protein
MSILEKIESVDKRDELDLSKKNLESIGFLHKSLGLGPGEKIMNVPTFKIQNLMDMQGTIVRPKLERYAQLVDDPAEKERINKILKK